MYFDVSFIVFSLDKEQIGSKRRKKIPHFSDYFKDGSGGGDPPAAGGGGGGGFSFNTLMFPGLFSFQQNPGTSQSSYQGWWNLEGFNFQGKCSAVSVVKQSMQMQHETGWSESEITTSPRSEFWLKIVWLIFEVLVVKRCHPYGEVLIWRPHGPVRVLHLKSGNLEFKSDHWICSR